MATKTSNKRLAKEYQAIQKSPPPYITAHPSEENILLWYYLIEGPPDTPYHGGQYMGTLKFPPEYPFKPPAVTMITPSGRFQPNTRLCFSFSDYHPKEWNPSWQVSTILVGLLSFMTSDANTAGSMTATAQERVLYAAKSRQWNSTQCPKFLTEFPEEHAKNLEWIRQTEQENARRQADEHAREQEQRQRKALIKDGRRKEGLVSKWIVIGLIGAVVAARAWQRFREVSTS